ncbi:MAG: hypothetical protein PVH87_22970 [Desulfobacteraceae bacterium]|jgi:hypothetical protein
MMDPFNNDGIGQQQNLPGTRLRIENLIKDTVSLLRYFRQLNADAHHRRNPHVISYDCPDWRILIATLRLAMQIDTQDMVPILKDAICEGVVCGV